MRKFRKAELAQKNVHDQKLYTFFIIHNCAVLQINEAAIK